MTKSTIADNVQVALACTAPTEAAVYSLIVSVFIYRELTLKDLYAVFATAAKTASVGMFLVAASLVSAWLITVAELPTKIVALLEPLLDNKIVRMFAIMIGAAGEHHHQAPSADH